MRRIFVSALLGCAIGLASTAVSAQEQAGVSAAVRGQVALARASANIVGRQVQSGDPIFLGDAITSGKASGMQIMLMDETVFSIGPNSEISIDEFVYDPSTETGKVTASVAKGVFRFITGKIAQKRPEDMTVRLPTATIGIRGTIVAGAVRTGSDDDASVNSVFEGLKDVVADGENAKAFVVLLGPGDENNTNDRGGAFVFTPNAPERANSGLSAGAPAPGSTLSGGVGSVEISRPGNASVSYDDGTVSPPFQSPDVAIDGVGNSLGAQPPGGPKGSPDDANAQEANGTSTGAADTLAGQTIADANAAGGEAGRLADVGEPPIDQPDPAGFDFADLRAIQAGSAFASNAISAIGPFLISNSFFQVNFGQQTFQFDIQVSSGGGLSSAQFGCFSSCNLSYANLSGPAVFDQATIAGAANLTRVNCDNCSSSISFQDSTNINVFFSHDGVADGTASVNMNQ